MQDNMPKKIIIRFFFFFFLGGGGGYGPLNHSLEY